MLTSSDVWIESTEKIEMRGKIKQPGPNPIKVRVRNNTYRCEIPTFDVNIHSKE